MLNVVKRRRIDVADAEFAKYTYLAHPFAKNNGLRLIDDVPLDKVLSLQSLATDINLVGKEKENAVHLPSITYIFTTCKFCYISFSLPSGRINSCCCSSVHLVCSNDRSIM